MGHFEKRKEFSRDFVRFFYQPHGFRSRRMKENVYPFFRYEIFTIMAWIPAVMPVQDPIRLIRLHRTHVAVIAPRDLFVDEEAFAGCQNPREFVMMYYNNKDTKWETLILNTFLLGVRKGLTPNGGISPFARISLLSGNRNGGEMRVSLRDRSRDSGGCPRR